MWVGASTTSSSAQPCARASNTPSSAPTCKAPTIAPSELKSACNKTLAKCLLPHDNGPDHSDHFVRSGEQMVLASSCRRPDATVGAKPSDRVGQRLRRRRLWQAK